MVDRCPFCGGPSRETLIAREMMFGLRDPFDYFRCARCASLWLSDPPKDLSRYYGTAYYSMATDGRGANPIPGASIWTRTLLRLPTGLVARFAGRRGFPRYITWIAGVNSLTLSSRIADIGSGEGGLVFQMARHGFRDVWGFDPFITKDRDLGNAHLRRSDLANADGEFAVIMFNHALEHVPDPVASLRHAATRLTSEGVVIVRVPVAGSFADRHYGPHWVALDAPRHLAVPSQMGMRIAAEAVGLTIQRVFFDSQPLQFWASEQYMKDIPLQDDRSGCEPTQYAQFRRRAQMLNAEGDGDMAGYVLVQR